MFESIARLFDTTGFTPRSACGESWNPALIWLHIGSDLFIWLAYLSIPLVLLYFVRRRDLPYPRLFVLFALFILFCGFGHFLEALMFQYPLYRLSGVWKALTAVVSWATVIALVPIVPRVMASLSVPTRDGGPAARANPVDDRAGARDYIVAVLAAVLALLLRAAVDDLVKSDHLYILSLVMVVFVAWQSGFWPGLVTLAVSLVGMVYFFVEPRRSFVVEDFGNQLATALFFFCGVCCAALGEAQHTARRRARQALTAALIQKDELVVEVARRQAAQADLRASEAKLRAFYDSSPVCMGIVEPLPDDIRHVYDNRASCDFFGVGPGATANRRATEMGTPRPVLDLWLEKYWESAAKGAPVQFEYEYAAPAAAGPRWLSATVSPLAPDPSGQRLFCYVAEDVTARRRAERDLRDATRRLGAILDSITDAAFGLDPEFRYTYANRHWEAMFGRPASEVVGRPIWDVFPKLLGTPVEDGYRQAMRDRVAVTVELVHPATGRWVEFRAYPADDGGLGVYLRDIEDRKRAERERQQLQSLVESSTDLIGLAALGGEVTYFNDAGLRLLGLDSIEAARGKTLFDFVVPEDLPRLRAEMLPALEREGRWEGEWRYQHAKTGAAVPVSKKVTLIRDPDTGRPAAYATVSRDISDRLRAEADVRESEGRFRTMADSAPALVWLGGPDGSRTYFNRTWLEFTGRTPEQEAGDGWVENVHPEDRDSYLAGYRTAVARRVPFEIEYRLRRRDGEYRWVLARGVPRVATDGGYAGLVGLCLDVTDRRRADEAVRESEERFRTLAAAVPQIVWVTRPDGYHEYYNPKWYEYTGLTEAESLGYGWSTPLHPDDAARSEARWKQSTDTGEVYEIEYRFRGRDGNYRWFLGRALPQRDASGTVVRWFGTCTDIHDARLATDVLKANEERFRNLTEAMPQIVWHADAKGEVNYFNRRWLDYTGEGLDKARGRGWMDAVHPDDRDRVFAAWRDTVADPGDNGHRFAHELRLRNGRTGEYRWFLTVAVPVRGSAGAVEQWIGSMADIHDQKTAAASVEEANHFLEATINALPSHIAVLDSTGVILKVNDAWRRFGDANGLEMPGYGVGSNYLAACDVVCSNDPELRLSDGIRAVIAGDEPTYRTEYPCHSPAERRWFQMRVNRFPGDGPVRVVVAHENITDRVLAEEAVRRSEEEFRQLADSMPQIVFAARPDGHVDYFNRRWYEYTGFADDGTTGDESWAGVHEPDALPRVAEAWGRAVRTGELYQIEYRLRRADGEFRWHLGRALPVRGTDGRIVRWFGTNTDIHDAKTAADNLRASEERFRTLTEAVPQMVWTADAKGEVTFVNRRWDEYTGRPLERGRTLGWDDMVHPDDAEQLRAEWQLAVANQPDLFTDEFRLRRASDGAYRWMLSTAVPLRDPSGRVVEWVGSITDIDDQKRYAETLERTVRERTAALVEQVDERTRAEAEVRKQREFLDAILANVTDGIVACDEGGVLTLFNRAALEFHGVAPRPLGADDWSGAFDLYRPDGETPLPKEEVPLFRALSGEPVRDAEMVIAPHGRPPRFVLASGQRLTDAEGRSLGAVISMRDVTERREADRQLGEAAAELRRANAELERSNGELEQFAYVASHDLQEPLRKIQAFGDRLTTKFRTELPDAGKEYVDRMLVSAGRMRRLIDDLLSFSRVTTQARPFAPVDLGKLVPEVVNDLSDRIEQTHAEVRVGPLPTIDADPTQMRQLFQNLIVNAVKFQRPGVPPVVEVSAELGELPQEEGEPVPVCRVTVRDNGIGFDEKYLDRIFQVFQRLHGREQYEGTGVGLAICRKITERHGGTITARSRPGEGAAFIVTLPVRHPAPPDAGAPNPAGDDRIKG